MPLFSVIIPTFNAAATLARALDSVLAQTFTDYEIIVVNDGSTDATADVLASYGEQVRVVAQENRGLAGARNSGARAACGAWLALLDADDSWTPDKLAAVADRVREDPSPIMWFSDAICVRADGSTLPRPFMPPALAKPSSVEDMMAGRFQILPSSAVIKAHAYHRAGGFSEQFKGASGFEDVFFWLCLREQGAFGYLPARLAVYTTTPLPIALARYKPGFVVFKRLVRERYGSAGERLIAQRRRARANRWSHIGLVALDNRQALRARWAFRNALQENPWRMRNLLRYFRTFIPFSFAERLSAKAARTERRGSASPFIAD